VDHGKAIARGTPRELIASLGVEHVVQFSVGAEVLDLIPVERIAGVRSAKLQDGTVELQVSELHQAVPALLAEVERQGLPLTELSTHSATLEDVFVSLTGRHLRDA
jgi:ABC-2 type transport system ATP-binding protein